MILLKAPIISPILPEYSESYAHAYAPRVPILLCTKYFEALTRIVTAIWRLYRGRWAHLPELSKGGASCSFHVPTFKNIRIFAKIPDIFRKSAVNKHFILIFFSNNLHISKKSSTFVPLL